MPRGRDEAADHLLPGRWIDSLRDSGAGQDVDLPLGPRHEEEHPGALAWGGEAKLAVKHRAIYNWRKQFARGKVKQWCV